jgi:hypothetical protein
MSAAIAEHVAALRAAAGHGGKCVKCITRRATEEPILTLVAKTSG